jgi:hypothetical protein
MWRMFSFLLRVNSRLLPNCHIVCLWCQLESVYIVCKWICIFLSNSGMWFMPWKLLGMQYFSGFLWNWWRRNHLYNSGIFNFLYWLRKNVSNVILDLLWSMWLILMTCRRRNPNVLPVLPIALNAIMGTWNITLIKIPNYGKNFWMIENNTGKKV